MRVTDTRVTTVDMFGAEPGRGSALDILFPGDPDEAAQHARESRADETVLVNLCDRAERTFASQVFTASGETPFATHSLAGTAAHLVSAGRLAPGSVGRISDAGCQWLWTDGREVRVPFDGPALHEEITGEVFEPYGGTAIAAGVGRAFTFVQVERDPRDSPAPDLDLMWANKLTDLTLFRWDRERGEVLARVFAPGFGIPEDAGCLPVAAALGVLAVALDAEQQGAPVMVRQVTERGTESVFTCVSVVDDGTATVNVIGRVWGTADRGGQG
ncbi:putative PhzF superfamily epimerase YddE/YHI9 [Actinokineospora cianjurensis]|uniref:Putative PhzF superfamily epimerase YddE/YHI9 n=1 Tax=Actinokineospora cianjurensis TaxID=585224 RepID=A0A421B1L9_9PSEU|nr:putative PhzF superfamily epimerase YddE/YHI9 [Actinokineospora cianjurensis]